MQREDRERRRRLVPQKSFSQRSLCPVLSSRPSLMSGYILASNHDISFFFRSVWGSCHGKLYCSRDIFKPQTIKFPRGKLPREKSVTLKKSSFPSVTVYVALCRVTVLWAISRWRPPPTCSMAASKGKKNHDLLNFQFNFPS